MTLAHAKCRPFTDCQTDSERRRCKTLNEPSAGRAKLPVLIHLVGSAQRPKQKTKMTQTTEYISDWFVRLQRTYRRGVRWATGWQGVIGYPCRTGQPAACTNDNRNGLPFRKPHFSPRRPRPFSMGKTGKCAAAFLPRLFRIPPEIRCSVWLGRAGSARPSRSHVGSAVLVKIPLGAPPWVIRGLVPMYRERPDVFQRIAAIDRPNRRDRADEEQVGDHVFHQA